MFIRGILHYFCLILTQNIIFAKIYNRCDLFNELSIKHSIPAQDLADWICILFWESGFDTKAYHIGNFDGSSNYGIFQINDLLWCHSIGKKNNTNFCNSSCEKFRDSDISDDVKCALLIYKLQGFSAWGTYNTKCSHVDLTSYSSGCDGLHNNLITGSHQNGTETDQTFAKMSQIIMPSLGKAKQSSSLIQQLLQMSKNSMTIPENFFSGIEKRSIGSQKLNSKVNKKSKRFKRGVLGQDSINPFEDARIFVFNPLCCFNWKAADVEWSNMKNWLRDIRTTVG